QPPDFPASMEVFIWRPFRLFGRERRAEPAIPLGRDKLLAKTRQIVGERIEAAGLVIGLLVHVQPAIDLDLQGLDPLSGPAVMFGYEAARIGLVVRHRISHAAEYAHGMIDQPWRGRAPEAVAYDDVGPPAILAGPDAGRHGM